MSGTDDLRELLDKLKSEVGPMPAKPARVAAEAPVAPAPFPPEIPERRYGRGTAPEPARTTHLDGAWRENREAIFFGMMAALVAALGGVLSGLEYLVVAGTALFCLFSLVMAYGLFVQVRPGSGNISPDLQARLDLLTRRVDAVSSRPAGHSSMGAPRHGTDPETERKIEELYSLFRSVAKAVGRKSD